jgi:hypothetical protein
LWQFFDEGQELGLCTQTIYKNACLVLFFAVPLHRQSEENPIRGKLMTKDNNSKKVKLKKKKG